MEPRTVHDDREHVQILDVREPHEFDAGHIEGATNIPLSDLPRRSGELDQQRAVVTVCRAGGRASRAAAYLTSLGLNARVMHGGMQEWQAQALPFASVDGSPGRVI